MADDDDRSAELTTPKAQPRRRASRQAGPPVEETPGSGAVVAEPTPAALSKQSIGQPPALDKPVTVSKPTVIETPRAATTPGASARRPASGWKSVLGWAAAALVIVALVVAAVVLLLAKRDAADRDEQREAFVAAARQSVLNLTTIHPETAQQDVQRILDGSSGEFFEEFQTRQEPFVSVINDAKVRTDGEIIEAGLEHQTDGAATVLVAARAKVSSADQPDPQARDFRMRVTVTEVDGKLTASKVEFVP